MVWMLTVMALMVAIPVSVASFVVAHLQCWTCWRKGIVLTNFLCPISHGSIPSFLFWLCRPSFSYLGQASLWLSRWMGPYLNQEQEGRYPPPHSHWATNWLCCIDKPCCGCKLSGETLLVEISAHHHCCPTLESIRQVVPPPQTLDVHQVDIALSPHPAQFVGITRFQYGSMASGLEDIVL